ncbi:hypothetical protein P879_03288 [Paragonimus westermani]|uniref:Thioredoxin domain-containing protein n=1 Tax=Paragonimus westermani TaxID=34504 RepID=A0A8T0DBC8_9TREM|nr:hypothetical protein P879_03288 [Paragonimus westermani]
MIHTIRTLREIKCLIRRGGNKLLVVEFFANWSPPCKQISPVFVAMSERMTDVVFAKVDVDENQETHDVYSIECFPTFIFFKNGKELERLEGVDASGLRRLTIQYKDN